MSKSLYDTFVKKIDDAVNVIKERDPSFPKSCKERSYTISIDGYEIEVIFSSNYEADYAYTFDAADVFSSNALAILNKELDEKIEKHKREELRKIAAQKACEAASIEQEKALLKKLALKYPDVIWPDKQDNLKISSET